MGQNFGKEEILAAKMKNFLPVCSCLHSSPSLQINFDFKLAANNVEAIAGQKRLDRQSYNQTQCTVNRRAIFHRFQDRRRPNQARQHARRIHR